MVEIRTDTRAEFHPWSFSVTAAEGRKSGDLFRNLSGTADLFRLMDA